jgi:hypothetical protein
MKILKDNKKHSKLTSTQLNQKINKRYLQEMELVESSGGSGETQVTTYKRAKTTDYKTPTIGMLNI